MIMIKKTGPWIYWYSNGVKALEGCYLEGQKIGLGAEWRKNGTKHYQCHYYVGPEDYEQELKTGLYQNFEMMKLKCMKHFMNGIRTGLWIYWWENGNKKCQGHYEQEHSNMDIKWYESGIKWNEEHYENGEKTGLCTEWYENGMKHEEGHYITGKQTGTWIRWNPDGSLQLT